jgi:hypothetical protein
LSDGTWDTAEARGDFNDVIVSGVRSTALVEGDWNQASVYARDSKVDVVDGNDNIVTLYGDDSTVTTHSVDWNYLQIAGGNDTIDSIGRGVHLTGAYFNETFTLPR